MNRRKCDRQSLLKKDMRSCLEKHPDATSHEKDALLQWVKTGESPWNNPYHLYDETGYPMDYIDGCRAGKEMERDYDRDPAGFLSRWSMAEDFPDFVELDFDP